MRKSSSEKMDLCLNLRDEGAKFDRGLTEGAKVNINLELNLSMILLTKKLNKPLHIYKPL